MKWSNEQLTVEYIYCFLFSFISHNIFVLFDDHGEANIAIGGKLYENQKFISNKLPRIKGDTFF